ncbi:MAG TPA: glycosyltransferase family 4 protein [Thermoanaerobaculia bacterium]|nr:glycosyltransferase family 4 protein [Thermoanaerobaculia bacterium]
MNSRLRLVLPHVLLGGGETAMMEVAEALRGELDVSVRALDYGPPLPGLTVREELAARFADAGLLRHRWEIAPALRDADVVLWYGLTPAIPRALAELADRPASVRVVHTHRPEEVSFHRRWRREIDETVCVSPAVQRQIPGSVFIPNPMPEGGLTGARQDFFPGSARPVLGWLGRFAALKNVDWLVAHAGDLGCDLLVQGIDTEEIRRQDLERLAVEKGTAGRVRFLDPDRDVGTLLRSVDALVIASRHEGFPMVLIEAGRLGVPVIATRVGALPELFADEVLFVDGAGERPGLESMRRAVAALAPEWGERLRVRVAELCGRERVAGLYKEVVRQAALRVRVRAR